MAKKQLTATQKKNKYRALQYLTFGSEFLSIVIPFVAMGIVNHEEWFYNEDGWKIGLGGSLALALMGIAVFLVTKKKEENSKLTNGYISLIVGWFAVAFIFMLLADIMSQMSMIMLFGGIGLCGAFGLDLLSKDFKQKADAYKEVIKKAKQNVVQQEVEQDLKNKDVKF